MGLINASKINEGLIQFYSENEELEFNTFWEWKKKGFSVKKGSIAFLVWGKPKKLLVSPKEDETEETEGDEFKFWPIAYLFSEKQVEKTKKEKEVQNELA